MPKIECGKCHGVSTAKYVDGWIYSCGICEALNNVAENFKEEESIKPGVEQEDKVIINNDMTIHEWVGFEYKDYQQYIVDRINKNDFKDLAAASDEELAAGYLNKAQVGELRKALTTAVTSNWTIKKLMDEIKDKVKPGDLTVTVDALLDKEGNVIRNGYERVFDEEQRTEAIARTEITKSVNEGNLDQLKSVGVKKVKWSAALGDRTCDICAGMDGEVFDLEDTYGMLPYHINCRCSTIGIFLKED